MAVLSPQDGETADVFSSFSADGLYIQAFYWVIPLGFQKIKHQPFPLIQPSGLPAVPGRPGAPSGVGVGKR
ncbi:hypothetical protein [Bilophila sp.]|uniref:hypothetical protein n=1 Tax=Bilophila sp. TaxID=1929485 RepID=UPI0030777CE0